MSKYDSLASLIIQSVGGKNNITGLTHCMTRLRFDLEDDSKIDEKLLKNNKNIISTNKAAGKFQVIIGNSVADVYDEVVSQLGMNADKLSKQNGKAKEGVLTSVVNTICKVITPTLNVLVAAGLLKGLLALLVALRVVTDTSGTYAVINAIGDSIFYFFPIILGYTSAEAFGLNKFVGMLLGATLLYPSMVATLSGGEVVFSLFANTPFESNAYATLFGIPVIFPGSGYASTVIPIILINWFASKVEKLFKEHIPDIVGFAFVPFLTLLISASVGLVVIGPIANLIQSFIGWLTTTMLGISPLLTAVIVALIYQPLVIFGLHWPLIAIAITNFGSLGYDFLWPMMFTASFCQTAVVMAVGMKTKNRETKGLALPAIVSGLMCIIEPAIYGFSLPDKKRFAFSCIGAAVGAVIITLFNCVQYTLGIGLFGLSGFIDPATGSVRNVVIAVVATLVSMLVTFFLTYTTYKEVGNDDEQDTDSKSEEHMNDVNIEACTEGEIVAIDTVSDKTFSSEILGPSVAIKSSNGKITAPFDGVVESLFPTKHAIGLKGEHGESVMVHIGIDTVNLQGEGFHSHIKQGENFKKGDLLLEFDSSLIQEKGYDDVVIVTVTNGKKYSKVSKYSDQSIDTSRVMFSCKA